MEKTGEYTYVSAATDRIGRHREIAELMNALHDAHGPGKFTSERIPEQGDGPRSQLPSTDFSSTIRWRWRTS